MEKKKNKASLRIPVKISCCLLIAAAALSFAANSMEGFGEWYAVNVYPLLVNTIGRLSGLLPFSLSEALCFILVIAILADIVINRRRLVRIVIHLLVLASMFVFVYEIDCGINYHRKPFVPAELYENTVFSEDDLADYCTYIITQLEDEDIVTAAYPGRAELAEKARDLMCSKGAEYSQLEGFYPIPKQLGIMAPLFSAMGVSGIYSPFTIEANINGQMPDMEKPFTACHELSHLRGYMIEAEANYIGWLACIGSDEPAFRRSGWLIAWSYAGSALRRTDPERFAALYEKLPGYAAEELADNHEFWVSHENKASEVQDKVNDAYLKTNGVEDGIASYGRLTTLMLMWFQETVVGGND